jgi:hypothetical protein
VEIVNDGGELIDIEGFVEYSWSVTQMNAGDIKVSVKVSVLSPDIYDTHTPRTFDV